MDIRRTGFFVSRCVRSFFSGGRILVGLLLCLLFIGGFASPDVGRAALARDAYQASLLSVSAPSKLAPGEMGQMRVEFRNVGTASWLATGKNFVSLYRWNPLTKLEMASQFATPAWETTSRPLRLPVAKVSSNTSVVMNVPIRAPLTAGTYTETFILTAEDLAWMKYGQVTVTLVVGQTPQAQVVSSVSGPAVIASVSVSPSPAPSLSPMTSSSGEWAAELVEKSGSEWQLDPEGTANITLTYKNTGTKTWTRDSAGFLSLYAADGAKERSSAFAGSLWSGNAATRLKEREVRPGQTGTFAFQLRAPKTAGSYKETFTLAAERVAWVQGSGVTLPIRVIPSQTFEFVASGLPDTAPLPVTANTTPDSSSSATKIKRTATLLLRSIQAATLLGNGRQEVQVGFKNTSDVTWNSRALRLKGMVPVINARWASVRDDSWLNTAEPVRKVGDVKPGEIAFLTFKVKAPAKKGKYTVSFALYADGEPVQGGDIDIPITVTADGYIEPEPVLPPTRTVVAQPNTPTPAPLISFPPVDPVALSGDPSSLPAEPMIRVGIFRTTDDQMMIRAMQVPVVVSQNGTTICRLGSGQSATVQFDRTNKVYKISGGSCTGQSSSIYLFRTEDGIAPMELADFSRPVGWLPGANDNGFRAQLELRYTPATDGVWVINELPIEWYLKGIAETSNVSPQEFQRTLLVTARTYATYHVQRGTKHADESYTVDARYDQVYRGYGAEARNPNVVAAVDATRGQIVTYRGKLAITPYFSRSDGRTRSWGEVWYGASQYPWLVSVPVPQDQGKTLWGHGVGMSASGALGMANEGKRYDQILGYFYQGTELRKAYR